jgi:arylsulfatase A-like enzyme
VLTLRHTLQAMPAEALEQIEIFEGGNQQMKKTQTKPDIILIVLDTLRADRLSCYGYSRETSPYIDAFAAESTLFERAISPAQWTIPAHASIFTGEYPTTHLTTQIYDRHNREQIMLAEALRNVGYNTVSFCNNPLLGVVENDLDRGFEEVYLYGGALPNRPAIADARPRLTGRIAQRITRVMRSITRPIQDRFARDNFILRIAVIPWLVPLWQRYANFKGNTALSLRDIVGYLRTRRHKGAEQPLFTFINLMETHLPFSPPKRFIRRFAPYYRKERKAYRFMQSYNHKPFDWMMPLTEPLTEMQDRVLNDLYDAEVAYEDHLLRHLFAHLNRPSVRDNTLVIITSDHGEGLNRHDFVGHSLVAYDDLVRVPLIVRFPQQRYKGMRVSTPVSTRRIFHTALEAVGLQHTGLDNGRVESTLTNLETSSLTRTLNGGDPEGGIVFTEAYTPETLLTLIKNEDPERVAAFRCNLMRRAAYQGNYKLITVGDKPDELFDVVHDPDEMDNLIGDEPVVTAELEKLLTAFVEEAEKRRPANQEATQVGLDDELVAERLRGLGYIE